MKNMICSWLLAAAVLLPGSLNIASARDDDVRFAITSAVASDPSYENYRKLTRYIAAQLGKKSVFISGLSYNQVDNLFKEGLVDVGFLCNCHYARRKEAVQFEPIAAPVLVGHNKPQFQVYIIVPKDSPVKSLSDLKGKAVDLADPLSTTTLLAASLLQKKNETIKSFFGKAIYSGSHDMTIELVAGKIVDAGFIDGHIWEYHNAVDPAYVSKTRVIYRSQNFTTPPVVVSRNMLEEVRRKIRTALLTMNETPEGRAILKKLRIERFVDIREKDYQDVLQMYSAVKERI